MKTSFRPGDLLTYRDQGRNERTLQLHYSKDDRLEFTSGTYIFLHEGLPLNACWRAYRASR
jgi:NifB/MoaA-like Fe-S oxidoreductase